MIHYASRLQVKCIRDNQKKYESGHKSCFAFELFLYGIVFTSVAHGVTV